MLRDLLKRGLRRLLAGVPRVPNAPPTGRAPPSRAPAPAAAPVDDEAPEPDLERPAADLRARAAAGEPLLLIDVREPHELRQGYPEGALLMPMNEVPQRLGELPRGGLLAVVCAAGARSWGVAGFLREQGFDGAWSVAGGVGDWASAGGGWVSPPAAGPLRLLQPVRTPAGEPAVVQELRGERVRVWVQSSPGRHEEHPASELLPGP
jgi:rhodanese-related sulfurtransferase